MMIGGPHYPKQKARAPKPPTPGSRATKPGTQNPVGIAAMPRKAPTKPSDLQNGYGGGQKIARTPAKPKPSAAPAVPLGGAARPKAEY